MADFEMRRGGKGAAADQSLKAKKEEKKKAACPMFDNPKTSGKGFVTTPEFLKLKNKLLEK